MVSKERAQWLAQYVHLDLKKVPLAWWKWGVNYELANLAETERVGGRVLYTNERDLLAARIAIEHLKMYPDYYQRVKRMEDAAIRYWRNM